MNKSPRIACPVLGLRHHFHNLVNGAIRQIAYSEQGVPGTNRQIRSLT